MERMNFHTLKEESMGFLRGLLIGTALMFIFDPVSGRRRRALAKDKLT